MKKPMEENKNKPKPKPKLNHNTRNSTFAATRVRTPICVHESRLFVHMARSIYGSRTIDCTESCRFKQLLFASMTNGETLNMKLHLVIGESH